MGLGYSIPISTQDVNEGTRPHKDPAAPKGRVHQGASVQRGPVHPRWGPRRKQLGERRGGHVGPRTSDLDWPHAVGWDMGIALPLHYSSTNFKGLLLVSISSNICKFLGLISPFVS